MIRHLVGIVLLWAVTANGIAAAKLPVLTSPLPIFSEQQDNGRMTGYSVEYASHLLAAAGYTADINALPFARLMRQMATGELMVATGIGRTPEREDQFFWIAPMTANVIGLYTKSLAPIDDLADLSAPISVAVLRGDYRSEILTQFDKVTVVEFNTWEQAIGAVLLDRVDSVFFSDLGVSITCHNAGMSCDALKKVHTYDVLFSYMAMPKTEENREIATALANAVPGFIKSKAYNQISQRWLPQLNLISNAVGVVEGVIVLGKIDPTEHSKHALWVITNLEPLFSVRDERGNLTGYAVELVRSILLEAGLQNEILSAPWQRILVESEMKPEVLVFSLARTAEREEKFHWITPITQNAYSLFTHQSNQSIATDLDSLPSDAKVAVLKGDFREDIVKKRGLSAVSGEDWKATVKLFVEGHADYLFFSDGGMEIMCDFFEEQCGTVQKAFTYRLASTYLAISKQGTSQTLVDKLSQASMAFKQTPRYQKLVVDWLSTYEQQSSLGMHEHEGVIRLWRKEPL